MSDIKKLWFDKRKVTSLQRKSSRSIGNIQLNDVIRVNASDYIPRFNVCIHNTIETDMIT